MFAKIVAWMNTAAALMVVIAAIKSGNWAAAWFAFSAAWFSWMLVLRPNAALNRQAAPARNDNEKEGKMADCGNSRQEPRLSVPLPKRIP